LWFSANIRADVPRFVRVDEYPFQHPQRLFFNPFDPAALWVTSFGNGLRVGRTTETAIAPVPGAEALALTLSPNPARGRITVICKTAASAELELEVTDLLGRVVLRRERGAVWPLASAEFSLDLHGVPRGLYVLTVRSGSQRRNEKLLLE
jgi:hypothetical protein